MLRSTPKTTKSVCTILLRVRSYTGLALHTDEGSRKDYSMRKLFAGTLLPALAFCFLAGINPLKSHADTVTLTFESTGPGHNSGGVYTYPYEFSVDGSKTLTSLMCYSYTDEIYIGESWTATVTPISVGQTTLDKDEEELAYLFSVASNPASSSSTASAAQWAAWELFDSSLKNAPDQSSVTAELDAAANFIISAPSSFYAGYELYIPVDGSQDPERDGMPQEFIGTAPTTVTPEPGTLLLLGTGLLMLAGLVFRTKRASNQTTPRLAAGVL